MPRRKLPIATELTGPLVEFAEGLRDLRALAGNPTYMDMARKGLASKSGLSAADSGRELPTWEVTRAYVRACDGDLDEWEKRWTETRDKTRKPADADASPAPGTVSSPEIRPPAPRPVTALTRQDFQEALRQLHTWAGSPAYRLLADRASQNGLVLARSTISDMLCPRKGTLPTPTNLVSYLTVCALPADQHGEWVAVREAIAKARGRDRGPSLAKAPTPAERTDDDTMVRVTIKGKKVSWQIATADLPVVKPLLDKAWATLPEPVERQLHEQLEKGTNAAPLFADEAASTKRQTQKERQTRPHRAPPTWTSGPPLAVKVILCLVLVALAVACVYILINHG